MIQFNDKDGVHYKHPERSCKHCLKYPCIDNQENLLSNFAAYGCLLYSGDDIFEICKQ